jgi:hypothetical protein
MNGAKWKKCFLIRTRLGILFSECKIYTVEPDFKLCIVNLRCSTDKVLVYW